MSAAKKNKHLLYPAGHGEKKLEEPISLVKIKAEKLREKLQKSILDNPKLAKKAALLISLWMEGNKSQQKPKRPR